mmetsp:Transcript_11539/g.42206  ORF Transcript_11539/g.42206 Transcript_11539/m.42206 type:complete len:441 (+) Transcript_11539:200-1522(+)
MAASTRLRALEHGRVRECCQLFARCPNWALALGLALVFVAVHSFSFDVVFGGPGMLLSHGIGLRHTSELGQLEHSRPKWDESFDGQGSPCMIDRNTLTILTAAEAKEGEGLFELARSVIPRTSDQGGFFCPVCFIVYDLGLPDDDVRKLKDVVKERQHQRDNTCTVIRKTFIRNANDLQTLSLFTRFRRMTGMVLWLDPIYSIHDVGALKDLLRKKGGLFLQSGTRLEEAYIPDSSLKHFGLGGGSVVSLSKSKQDAVYKKPLLSPSLVGMDLQNNMVVKKIGMPFFLCALNLECFSSSHLSDHLDIHVAPVVLSLSVHAASVHGAFSVSTYAKAADMGASVVAQTTKPDIEFIRKDADRSNLYTWFEDHHLIRTLEALQVLGYASWEQLSLLTPEELQKEAMELQSVYLPLGSLRMIVRKAKEEVRPRGAWLTWLFPRA